MTSVRDFLEGSPSARAVAGLDLGAGRSVTIWENAHDRIRYDAPEGHAFSLYLKGGTGTRRLDAGPETGRPGTVCILPEGQGSDWEITTPFRFVHLYIPDAPLRAAFADIHDRDSRLLDLSPATFAERPLLAAPLTALAQAACAEDVLMAEAAVADLVAHLGLRPVPLSGGLSPRVLRRIDDWIDSHLDANISLADLAAVADLSPFHLHRMFRASRGMAPQAWILRKRIGRARAMLRTACPLIEIAVATGFSSQSHFTRAFRAQTGMTPTGYRRALTQ